MHVTARRRRGRPHVVYIFLIQVLALFVCVDEGYLIINCSFDLAWFYLIRIGWKAERLFKKIMQYKVQWIWIFFKK